MKQYAVANITGTKNINGLFLQNKIHWHKIALS